MSNLESFTDVKKFFSIEGWELFTGFLHTLEQKTTTNKINQKKCQTIFVGIKDYIQEYIDEHGEKKLTYEQTLAILNDIGSPNEIIFSMLSESTIKDKDSIQGDTIPQNVCNYCGVAINPLVIFCENCGKSISTLSRHPLMQTIIDRPYSASFYSFFLLFMVLGLAFAYNSNLNNWPIVSLGGILWSVDVLSAILILLVGTGLQSLIVAMIPGLICGQVGDWLLANFKSSQYKLTKLQTHFEDNVYGGAIMISLSSFMCILYFLNPITLSCFVLGFSFILATGLIIAAYWNESNRPTNYSYIEFLFAKKVLSKYSRRLFIQLNVKVGGLLLLLSTLIAMGYSIYYFDKSPQHALLTLVLLVYTWFVEFCALNGIISFWIYRWTYIERLMEKRQPASEKQE